jgi:LPS export ABC transporter protein LptC
MIRRRFFPIMCALLFIGFVIVIGYKENITTISPSYKISSMQDLYMTHREGGVINWELTAEKAIFLLGNKEIILTSPGLKINNKPEIILTSKKGVYEVEEGNVTLSKPVEMTMEEKKFVTDSLKWNSKDDSVTTEDDITFSGKNFLIKGTGLTARIKQEQVRIFHNVEAFFYR